MNNGVYRPRYDIGQILRDHLVEINNSKQFTSHHKRMLKAIAKCRTSDLGRHLAGCTSCGNVQFAYNSCRNRNCPKCQNSQREKWVQARASELLPVPYFHLVFTLPSELNDLCLHHPKTMYRLLFQASWYTVNKLGKDPKWLGAQMGMVSILHTWGSNLSLHPHLHCMVPAGGMDQHGRWKWTKSKGNYLFNRSVMGLVFRARYIKLLRLAIKNKKIPAPNNSIFKSLFSKEWITYAKRPFKNNQQILNYIGRYSHKIAITNYRITNVDKHSVSFHYKQYKKGGVRAEMKLSKQEFIRRFAMHIVPYKFVRIRHYGILSNRSKGKALAAILKSLGVEHQVKKSKPKLPPLPDDQRYLFCPFCKGVTVHVLLEEGLPIRGSPNEENLN